MIRQNRPRPEKVELKATATANQRPSNIFERLVFNAEIETRLLESGESIIARLFIGSTPPRLFTITNTALPAQNLR